MTFELFPEPNESARKLAAEIGWRLYWASARRECLQALKEEGLITDFAINADGSVSVTTLSAIRFAITKIEVGGKVEVVESAPD